MLKIYLLEVLDALKIIILSYFDFQKFSFTLVLYVFEMLFLKFVNKIEENLLWES